MMNIVNFEKTNCIINEYIAELRDVNVQTDRMRFRRNLERLGEAMAYEISKVLEYKSVTVSTPLGSKDVNLLKEQPVIATVLRAGIPLHQGFLNVFDKADSAFIGARRKSDKNENVDICVEYYSVTNTSNRVLIFVDPMLASGSSLIQCISIMKDDDVRPKKLHIVAAIASVEGIEYLKRNLHEKDVTLWVGAIDDETTAKSYIVPGLGDAGDLAYGSKK